MPQDFSPPLFTVEGFDYARYYKGDTYVKRLCVIASALFLRQRKPTFLEALKAVFAVQAGHWIKSNQRLWNMETVHPDDPDIFTDPTDPPQFGDSLSKDVAQAMLRVCHQAMHGRGAVPITMADESVAISEVIVKEADDDELVQQSYLEGIRHVIGHERVDNWSILDVRVFLAFIDSERTGGCELDFADEPWTAWNITQHASDASFSLRRRHEAHH
jgi:hypothetical protein